jgi:hypothetical protein
MARFYDANGRFIGETDETTTTIYVRGADGSYKGQYDKTSDRTYGARGDYRGTGNQTGSLLDDGKQ